MVEFGEKVKKLREEKGMTQQTMADQLYVTRQAVSRWECGARFPDLLTAKKIAQILEVSVDELLSGEELKKSIERDPVLSAPVSKYDSDNTLCSRLSRILINACVQPVFFLSCTGPERNSGRENNGDKRYYCGWVSHKSVCPWRPGACFFRPGTVYLLPKNRRCHVYELYHFIIDVPCGSHGYDNKTERPYGPVRLAGSVYSRIICGMYPCIFQQTRGKAFSCHYLCDCRRVVH